MKPITENIKIKVNPEQSAIVQEICFKQGIDWHKSTSGPAKSIKFEAMPALLIDVIGRYNEGKCLYWQGFHDYNAECHTKEYTFEQFVQEFGEQPVKENLEKGSKPRKHAELIKAWADGAEIQYKTEFGEWSDCFSTGPWWSEDTEYRIKPAEPIDPTVSVAVQVYFKDGVKEPYAKAFDVKLSEIEEFIDKHSNSTL